MIDPTTPLTLGPQDLRHLRKAGKWSRLLGIISMVSLTLLVVTIVVYHATVTGMIGFAAAMAGGSALVTLVLAIYAAVLLAVFYLAYLMYKFGDRAVVASDAEDHVALTAALAALGRLFMIYGILLISYLALTAAGLVYAMWPAAEVS